jgi:hypothetical protein
MDVRSRLQLRLMRRPGSEPARRAPTVRVGIDDVADGDEHGDLAQGSDVLDVHALDRRLEQQRPGARMYGWLHEHRTGTRLRPATGDEFERAARAAVNDGGSGIILIGGLECTVIVDE